MRRRTFIKTTGAAAIPALLPWPAVRGADPGPKQFLRERSSPRMLFPRPLDGMELRISPVGLAWLPCPDAAGYRVEIRDAGGHAVHERTVGKDPVHLPDQVFPAGRYEWDVIALNAAGTDMARRGWQSYTILPDARPLPWVPAAELLRRVPAGHPRVLYPRDQLAAIRSTLHTTRKESWKACLAAADRALRKGLPRFPDYHRIQDAGTQRLEYQKYFGYIRGYIDGALMDLAMGFLFSEEEKYARAAKELLLELASWPTDDADVTSVRAKWGDEIGLSFSKCAHLAYDWLHPALNAAERGQVLEMCRARAGQTYRRLLGHNYLTYPGDSHEGRLIAYLSDMSLALAGEAPEAETWLEYSLKALTTFYPHWGGSDGGWAEGTAYGLWYNTFYIPAFESLRQLTGFDLWQRPFFNQVRHFFFYCTANHGEIRPFGDSAETGGPGVGGGSGYAELMAFHAQRFEDPVIGWWVNQIPGVRPGGRSYWSLLHEDRLPSKKPEGLPNSRAFRGVGWAGLHSDVASPENDTCLIFKSSPYGSVSHSHADQNAFAIMKGGRALAIPSGYYGPSYGKPHHSEWTRSTKANNCILVDGEGQAVRVSDGGRILGFEDRPGHTYVAGDATPAYQDRLTRWVRHILFLRPGLFLMLDEIEAPRPATFQWMLHAFDRMEVTGQRVISRRGPAVLEVTLAAVNGLRLSQTDQFDTPYNHGIPEAYHREKPGHWHVTAETRQRSARTTIAAVLAVHDEAAPLTVEVETVNGWLGAKCASDANSDSRAVEGWIRFDPAATEAPFTTQEPTRKGVRLWGRDRGGAEFAV